MKKITTLLLLIGGFFLFSCSSEKNREKKDAFLIYSASYARDISGDLSNNVNQIINNYEPTATKDIYVLFKNRTSATLYRVEKKKKVIVKEYGDINTVSPATLDMVINDLKSEKSVLEVTDILFSSHGTSWLPAGVYAENLSKEALNGFRSISIYSFGEDLSFGIGPAIDIDQMAKVLESHKLNSIIFDACYMAGIEVLYQLRNSAKYILASPAEILAEGMDYNTITPYFNQSIHLDVLAKIAEKSYLYYQAKSKLFDQSIALTVTDCSKLEKLATTIKKIISNYGSAENNKIATPRDMIRYDGRNGYFKDYKQYLDNLIRIGNGTEQEELDAVWKEAFPHYYHTDNLFNWMDIRNSGGVAGYILRDEVSAKINDFYKSLDWGKLILQNN